jgi:dynein heavy chain
LDETHLEIVELEAEMSKIQDAASLFEVNVADFKQIKQCRKELRMLKVKWLTLICNMELNFQKQNKESCTTM